MGDIKPISDFIDYQKYASKNTDDISKEEYKIDGVKVQRMHSYVYHGLTHKFGLTPTETLVMALIISMSKKTGCCYMSEKTMSSVLGLTIQTINANLKNLIERNLIERKAERHKRYGTIQWKIGAQVEDYLNYIKEQIRRAQNEQR